MVYNIFTKDAEVILKKYIIIILLSLMLFAVGPAGSYELVLNNTPTKVCFSPKGRCTESIIKEIDQAKNNIFVQAYSFTAAPIAKALVDAHKRGLHVEVILDKSQRSQKYTSASFLANSRVPTYIDADHAIAHNKIIIIDKETVITGSFNFTKNAESNNAENLIILKSKDLAEIYINNWQAHRSHSEEYKPRY